MKDCLKWDISIGVIIDRPVFSYTFDPGWELHVSVGWVYIHAFRREVL